VPLGAARATVYSGVVTILGPARKVRLSEEVIQAIKDAIRRGVLRPGQRLVETDIAAQMQVSKAPVREALRQLQAEGLVVSYPQRGTFVVDLTDHDLWEIATLRAALEGLALELAAQRIDDEGLRELEHLLERIAAPAEGETVTDLHLQFHYLPLRYCGHRRLQAMLESLRAQAHTVAALSLVHHDSTAALAEVHRPMLEALRARDSAVARKLVTEHMPPELRGEPSDRGPNGRRADATFVSPGDRRGQP
jgi:DNA-binding GntR family transcriptional regulator